MGNEFCAHTRALAESFRKTRPRELHIGVESDFHPAKKAHAAFAVQDLGKLRATLQAHNIKVTGDDSLPDTRRFYAEDPFGERPEFLEAGS